MRTLIVASVILLAPGLLPAQAGEDPAVVLCEQAAKADLPAQATYRRVSARIQGRVALVTYAITLPSAGSHEASKLCEYRLDRNQRAFVIQTYRRVYDWQSCDGPAATLDAPIPADEKSLEERIMTFAECLDQRQDRTALLDRYIAAAAPTGLYPIRTADTALR